MGHSNKSTANHPARHIARSYRGGVSARAENRDGFALLYTCLMAFRGIPWSSCELLDIHDSRFYINLMLHMHAVQVIAGGLSLQENGLISLISKVKWRQTYPELTGGIIATSSPSLIITRP